MAEAELAVQISLLTLLKVLTKLVDVRSSAFNAKKSQKGLQFMASTSFFIDQYTGDNTQVKVTMKDVDGGVQVTLDVITDPESGIIGDLEGVFFHIAGDAVFGSLSVSGTDVTNSVFGPLNSVLNLGGGVNLIGEGQTGFDFGIKLGDQGGSTPLKTTTFTILGTNLDISDFYNANPNGNDIGIRLKSTTGSEGSSKLGGEITPPQEPPKENGYANTPGFWKNHADPLTGAWIAYGVNGISGGDKFATVFGLSNGFDFDARRAGSQDTLLDALGAGGGGINALARAGTAALLNAASDPNTTINYIYTDETQLVAGLSEVYKAGWTDAQKIAVLDTLKLIDANADGRIGVSEVKAAVNYALTVGGNFDGSSGISAVATAFDVLNNMQSVEVGSF
jgi:hypothetical protein